MGSHISRFQEWSYCTGGHIGTGGANASTLHKCQIVDGWFEGAMQGTLNKVPDGRFEDSVECSMNDSMECSMERPMEHTMKRMMQGSIERSMERSFDGMFDGMFDGSHVTPDPAT